MEKVN